MTGEQVEELPPEPEIGHAPWRGREWEELAGGLVLLIVVLGLIVGVVARYVFNHPLVWPQPIAQFGLIWVTFLGAAVGFKREIHLTADIVTPLWRHDVARRIWRALLQVITILALAVFTWYAAWYALEARSVTAIPGITLREVYVLVPVASALAVGYSIRQLIQGIRS